MTVEANNKKKKYDKLMRIPSNYCNLLKAQEKITCTRYKVQLVLPFMG